MQFDIRRLDIYRKIPKDLTQPTGTGACISVMSVLFICYLLFAELYAFITPELVSELFVDDPTRHHDRIPVLIDISLYNTQCEFLGLDIQDDLGRHEVGFVDDTVKTPIYGDKGCRLAAKFKINKVPGNFHISTHSTKKQPTQVDMTHFIREVRFGDKVYINPAQIEASFNPLAFKDKKDDNPHNSHDYFLKVVPSIYKDTAGNETFPYQYTYAHRSYLQYGHGHRVSAAIWFRYDLSPITVKYTEKRPPLYTFLTMVCAIIGGTFTVAGIFDSLLFSATETFKKFQIGKLS